MAQDTLVIFLSDNGMAFPFAKANCYLNSTKTPFIARWPGEIKAGTRNSEDYITGIDFTPTVLEISGLEGSIKCDGRSYAPLLRGEKQENRDTVFTQFNTTSAKNSYPMRCVQSRQFGYIFNAWSDGETLYKSESKKGLTYKAMKAAESDPYIAARVKLYDYRCKEEFYDFSNDPDALNNLIDDRSYEAKINEYRNLLRQYLHDSDDPQKEAFNLFRSR
jgi:N-sulfoglucosamine sulfohydrolase